MDLLKMIAELQTEKERLDEAILALERLSTANSSRRRGRPSRGLKDEPHALGAVRREQAEEENDPSV